MVKVSRIHSLVVVLACVCASAQLLRHHGPRRGEAAEHLPPSITSALCKLWLRLFTQLSYRILVPELYTFKPKPPSHSTAIVIGSGFGGSIAALRLAEAGIQTTVLERGQSWPMDQWRDIHTYEPLRDGRGLWQRTMGRTPLATSFGWTLPVDKFGGILDVTEYENIEIWRAACVGGGSKVFAGVMIQPRQEYFEAIFGDTVSWAEMDNIYYPRVRQMLNLSPVPDDIYNSKEFAHRRVWDQQASNAGYTVTRPDSIFNWNIIRDELQGRSRKSAIIGMSNMGNSNGAKFDTTQNYLKKATETGNSKVYSNQQVTDIHQIGATYVVDIERLNPSGSVVERYSITSKYLFLAAGSVGTSELLVKAKAKGTISGLNDEIGRGWGSNGDAFASRSNNPIKGLVQTAPCTGMFHDTNGTLPVALESWYTPGNPLDIGIQGSLAISFDLQNRGNVELVWPKDGNKAAEESARRVNNILAASEPKSVPGVFLLAPDVWAGLTPHPLGGAVVGRATDAYGRVLPRLYVMDGAAIPGSTGAVNPSLTISALAERNMERIIGEDF